MGEDARSMQGSEEEAQAVGRCVGALGGSAWLRSAGDRLRAT